MIECFGERNMLVEEFGGVDGWFPPGMQAVCVREETEK